MSESFSSPAMETQGAVMAAAAALVLLGFVLRQRRERGAWLFAALIAAFAAFGLARWGAALGWGVGPLATGLSLAALGALAPSAGATLAGSAKLRTHLAWWVAAGVVASALVATAAQRPALLAAGALALSGAAAGTLSLLRASWRRPESDSPDAVRLRYLAIAHAVAFFGCASDLVAGWLRGPQLGALLAPLLYLYAGYLHLARVRVADLRQLIGNAFSLSFLAGGMAAAFGALWLWVGSRPDLFLFNAFVASFLLLLLLDPSRAAIRRAMDRRFVAGRLELERGLARLRERMPQLITLDELLAELLDAAERISRLRASAVFLRDDPQVGFQQVGSIGLEPRRRVNLIRDPDWVEALEAGGALLAEELERSCATARKTDDATRFEGLRALMRELDAQLVLPLRTDAGLVGFWALSDVRSSEPFSSSEVELLCAVADELAVAIENSKTFERVRVRDKLASLGEMAAGLAHELRNPLATIRGALAVMAPAEEDRAREFQEVIVEEVGRLDRVVGTFLDYARPQGAQVEIPDLSSFVRGCAEEVARCASAKRVEIAFEEPSEPASAIANPDQLERVMANLVLNAYQALAGKGRIEIAVRRELDPELGPCAEIRISDDGPGMAEETLERALLPFFTTKEKGTGLGLALCDRLVRAQGGLLRLRSRPGCGTTAAVLLPAAPQPPQELLS